MSALNFPAVMAEVFRHEGGYVNDRRDPGGETKFGISKRSYPAEDILNLTKARAAEIYRQDFWLRISGDHLPAGMDLVTMDPAVNSGLSRGVRWLQQALGVKADGVMGSITLRAAQNAPEPAGVISRACALRMGFLRGLRTWGAFGKGWSRRVASVEAVACAMATNASPAALKARVAEAGKARLTDQTGAATVGGGATMGGVSLPDLPVWSWVAMGLLALVLTLHFLGRARHNRARIEAFTAVAQEAEHGAV